MKYSKDNKVRYNPKDHSYWHNETRLTGVTTYIKNYTNPFDADKIAEKYAKKHGLIKEDILTKWKLEGELSAKNGTDCHSFIEDYINEKPLDIVNISQKQIVALKFIADFFITKRLIPVETELLVYNLEMGLASQIDCIAKNTDGEYFILDWKTNKEIKKESWGKYMLGEFNTTPDANFYHYSLQLSLYKKMCTEYNIKKCFIVHLDNFDYKIIEIEYFNL